MNKSVLWAGIAVLAVAAAVYVSFATKDGAVSYDNVHIQCADCGNQWELSAQAAAEERAAAGDPRKKMTCPACRKDAGESMTQCDKCAHWYLPKDASVADRNKCQNCGFDPDRPGE